MTRTNLSCNIEVKYEQDVPGGDKMICSKLKLERIKQAKSQVELSNIAGVSRGVISQIENGKIDTVQLGILKKIAKALGLGVAELFLSEEDR